jgi:hypothetical protein
MHYRQIWEEYTQNKIPDGYEIHHIDGNRANNNPDNLVCVSIEEHLEIHIKQEDWGAVQAILARLDTDTTLLKLAASKAQKERWIKGTHNWQIKENKRKLNASASMQKRIQETGNAFIGIEDRTENSRRAGRVAAEKKAGFLNTSADHHGSKAVKNTKWWTCEDGSRKRSILAPGSNWYQGMKYKED